jgi:thymidylate synthase (FAD)
MKIIQPSIEYMGPVPTDYAGALRHIERCGRLCYKSEDKITEISAEPFVQRLINAGHLAMVEHSNFVVRTKSYLHPTHLKGRIGGFLQHHCDGKYDFVGGNLRAWGESARSNYSVSVFTPFLDVFGPMFSFGREWVTGNEPIWQVCPHDEIPKELHRYSVRFVCDRGVSHELVRHRPCSFAQESTRYVNYGGKEMEFIEPDGYALWPPYAKEHFEMSCVDAAVSYKALLGEGLKPQQARAVLPNALKTEIIVTADAEEWRHIRKLRTAKDAHPDIRRVMALVPWEEIV